MFQSTPQPITNFDVRDFNKKFVEEQNRQQRIQLMQQEAAQSQAQSSIGSNEISFNAGEVQTVNTVNHPVGKSVSYLNSKLMSYIFKPNMSIAFSPYSINYVMYMVYQGMDGNTKAEFEKAHGLKQLGFENDKILSELMLFDTYIQSNELKSANAQFVESSYTEYIKPEFKEKIRHGRFRFKPANFKGNAEGERFNINQWVSSNTNGLINEIIPQDALSEDTRIVLVNTVYLKMKWIHPFDRSYTSDFTRMSGQKMKAKLMGVKDDNVYYPYYKDANVQVISLPYIANTSDTYSFRIILPVNKTKFVLRNITDYSNMLNRTEVKVTIPKFTTEFETSLTKVYNKMGLVEAFDKENADFSRMTMLNKNESVGHNLYISDILHKCKIIVAEEGTEVVAATAVIMNDYLSCSARQVEIFYADHAFQYFIVHDKSDTILFSGVYNS